MQNTGSGRLLSVNVGRPRHFTHAGRDTSSAIWKDPVSGPVAARGVNLTGDDQADREVHGGPDKAVYSYASEDLFWWSDELGRELSPGAFGENLTTESVDVTGAIIGERWEVGSVILEVSEPRAPCFKLAAKMEDPGFPRQFTKAGRPGAYLRIVREGVLQANDAIRVTSRPEHGVSVGDVFRAFATGGQGAERLLSVAQLSESWKAWARERSRPRGSSST